MEAVRIQLHAHGVVLFFAHCTQRQQLFSKDSLLYLYQENLQATVIHLRHSRIKTLLRVCFHDIVHCLTEIPNLRDIPPKQREANISFAPHNIYLNPMSHSR